MLIHFNQHLLFSVSLNTYHVSYYILTKYHLSDFLIEIDHDYDSLSISFKINNLYAFLIYNAKFPSEFVIHSKIPYSTHLFSSFNSFRSLLHSIAISPYNPQSFLFPSPCS